MRTPAVIWIEHHPNAWAKLDGLAKATQATARDATPLHVEIDLISCRKLQGYFIKAGLIPIIPSQTESCLTVGIAAPAQPYESTLPVLAPKPEPKPAMGKLRGE